MLGLSSNGDATNQLVEGCVFRQLNFSSESPIGVVAGNAAIVRGNQFYNWVSNSAAIRADGTAIIDGNYFSFSGGNAPTAVAINGNDILVANNQCVMGTSGRFLETLITDAMDIHICNNLVYGEAGSRFFGFSGSGYFPQGSIHGNRWYGGCIASYTDVPATVCSIYNNDGTWNFDSTTSNVLPLEAQSGSLLRITPGSNTLAGRLAVKQNGQANCATTDTLFLGFATSDKDSTNGAFFVAGWAPGQIVPGVQTDGAWTAGNVGILSTTAAGEVHDTGATTIPAAGTSYVVFLDSGGSAGTARVLVMRTLG